MSTSLRWFGLLQDIIKLLAPPHFHHCLHTRAPRSLFSQDPSHWKTPQWCAKPQFNRRICILSFSIVFKINSGIATSAAITLTKSQSQHLCKHTYTPPSSHLLTHMQAGTHTRERRLHFHVPRRIRIRLPSLKFSVSPLLPGSRSKLKTHSVRNRPGSSLLPPALLVQRSLFITVSIMSAEPNASPDGRLCWQGGPINRKSGTDRQSLVMAQALERAFCF